MLKKLAIATALVGSLHPMTARADEWKKLACVGNGITLHITFNMTKQIAWWDGGGRSNFTIDGDAIMFNRENPDYSFYLDRSTLMLSSGHARYQCQKDENQI